ncbi:MAG: HlyD family type I secretion periplasmic adaptor subunit [Alsobacter sp.]
MSRVVHTLAQVVPAKGAEATPPHRSSIRRHVVAGLGLVGFLMLGVGGWAATTEFTGAVIAPGKIVVDSNDKKIQHPTGGVVGEIRVKDGDRVKAGEIIIRLDETVTKANLAIVSKSLDQLNARVARLEAEVTGAPAVTFPAEMLARAGDAEVARLMEAESGLFQLRATSRAGLKSQLTERIAQLKEEIEGLSNQIEAKGQELDLIAGELEGVRKLYAQNLVPLQRVSSLERETARLKGERGQLISSTAQAKGKISETQLQILQIDQDSRSDAAKDLREAQAKVAELVERKVTAEDQLKRIDLRAPQDGIVHQLAVHTVGGVINAGDTVMLIVPDSDRLLVEVRVPPQDIDDVREGQSAHMRLSAFNQRTTPEVKGAVLRVSPDLTTDTRTGQAFYVARIGLDVDSAAELKALRLVPGMPVEAFIETQSRTVASLLTRPLADQVRRAFREK